MDVSRNLAILFLTVLTAIGVVRAQMSSGTIAGIVTDINGNPIAGARIRLTKRDSGLTRSMITAGQGDFSAAALPPGEYTITAEAEGFNLQRRAATVETGTTTTVNLALGVGDVREQVTISVAAPTLSYESSNVSGVVTRSQMENLPLNGRNFLELAKLEPGAQASARTAANRNFVPALGQPNGNPGRGTRVTVDGGSIMAIGNGGSALGLSQEIVQEFQVSTVNFDLTTGITNGAAVNVTTRSGGNEFRGTGFYFLRDHNLAAYPALNRNAANPDPFFQRRQYGFALGGPIWRERLFFFGNYERNEQRGVAATAITAPEFAHLNRITPTPYFNNQFSLRFDGRLTETQTAFVRFSEERINSFGPPPNQPGAYPSSWRRQPAKSNQSIFGLTSVWGKAFVNDFRFSFFYVDSSVSGVTEKQCPGCIGLGAPSFAVAQTGLTLGVSASQPTVARRFHLNDYVSWQIGAHRVRFGADWEYNRGGSITTDNEPATLTLFSPQRARAANIPIPTEFRALNDFLQLPLQSVTVGIGDARVPQADGSLVRSWHTFRLFFQDAWRIKPRLTINYGLGWSVDRNLNYDLKKPALLAPILGADGLGATRRRWNNFSPVLGFSWSPRRDAKTVIRGGAGYYYDFLFFNAVLDAERATLGPPGSGRQNISGDRLANCLPNVPNVPVGAALRFNTPTRFTGANLLACLPQIRAELTAIAANADRSIQAIQLTKEGTVYPQDLPPWTALHFNFGVQRELMKDFVLSADFALRHFDHIGLGNLDLNRFNRARGPGIPRCETEAQRDDPNALCSTGAINVPVHAGRATYKGLLLRADKRFSRGFQILGSWAFSRNSGTVVNDATGKPIGLNLDDYLSSRGPQNIDFTHIFNLAGVVQLPSRFLLGFNFSYSSKPPFSPYVGGIDFNGDGTTDDLLPGTTVNQFNRGLGRADLERLVAQFNQTYAGRTDAKGVLIPRITLPAQYWFGDDFHSLDIRLSRTFTFEKRLKISLIGEVFNLYNAANLSGHSPNLTAAGFGQPAGRFTQVFGSGGPRAFQFGTRISF
jgi:hypothetical protein